MVVILATLCFAQSSYASGLQNKKTLQLRDEGVSQGDVSKLDCVGDSVACIAASGVGTVTISGGSASSPTQSVQFNSGGSFAGDASLIWDLSLNQLSISRDSAHQGAAFIISGDIATQGRLATISHDGGANFNSLTLRNRLSEDFGGTGNSSYTKGDLLAASATTTLSKLAVGVSDGMVLSVDSSTATGLRWGWSNQGSGWVDNGTDINLVTQTDNVGIGASSNGKLSVTGDTDEDQLFIKGNGTQTKHLAYIVASDNTTRLAISGDGTTTIAGTGVPGMILGNGQNAAYTITMDVVGTDTKMVGTSGNVSFSHDITVSGDNIAMLTNTKGGLLAADGTDFSPLTVGSNGQILSADSSQTKGVRWSNIAQNKVFLNFPVHSAKLSSDTSCRIDGGLAPYPQWRLLFDDNKENNAGKNIAMWQGRMDDNWQGGPLTAKIDSLMITSDSTSTANGAITYGVSIWAVTSGDAVSMTTESFATENSKTQGVATVVSRDQTVTIPLTNTDSLTAGDWFMVKLRRDGNDVITGDSAVISFAITE